MKERARIRTAVHSSECVNKTTAWRTDIISIINLPYSAPSRIGILRKTFCACILLAASAIPVSALTLDTLTAATEYTTTNVRMAALAGAGLAVPEGITSTIRNPALFHAYHRDNAYRLSATVSYGRDSLFSEHMLDGGFGYFSGEPLSAGFLYRYLRAAPDRDFSQFTLALAGRMFEGDAEQGSVDVGLSFRYEITDWHSPNEDTLWSRIWEYDDTEYRYVIADSAYGAPSLISPWEREVRRAALDVGFYQKKISEKLDFGITFHNILGYVWDTRSPNIEQLIKGLGKDSIIRYGDDDIPVDTVFVDTLKRDSIFYLDSEDEETGWITGEDKRVSVGILYTTTILDGAAHLKLPLDLELPGLFSRTFFVSLRTGLELCFAEKYCLRFGYARAPRQVILDGDLENANIFAGGAGVHFRPVTVDMYLRKKAWGLSVGVGF